MRAVGREVRRALRCSAVRERPGRGRTIRRYEPDMRVAMLSRRDRNIDGVGNQSPVGRDMRGLDSLEVGDIARLDDGFLRVERRGDEHCSKEKWLHWGRDSGR